ncbi:MAG: hypothetical protein LBM93_10435 [Oscillospiraceae bacterium]|jgi:hypothetical protein|nr:hypothetical protein [Oscillospiraceae bacterium]
MTNYQAAVELLRVSTKTVGGLTVPTPKNVLEKLNSYTINGQFLSYEEKLELLDEMVEISDGKQEDGFYQFAHSDNSAAIAMIKNTIKQVKDKLIAEGKK